MIYNSLSSLYGYCEWCGNYLAYPIGKEKMRCAGCDTEYILLKPYVKQELRNEIKGIQKRKEKER